MKFFLLLGAFLALFNQKTSVAAPATAIEISTSILPYIKPLLVSDQISLRFKAEYDNVKKSNEFFYVPEFKNIREKRYCYQECLCTANRMNARLSRYLKGQGLELYHVYVRGGGRFYDVEMNTTPKKYYGFHVALMVVGPQVSAIFDPIALGHTNFISVYDWYKLFEKKTPLHISVVKVRNTAK